MVIGISALCHWSQWYWIPARHHFNGKYTSVIISSSRTSGPTLTYVSLRQLELKVRAVSEVRPFLLNDRHRELAVSNRPVRIIVFMREDEDVLGRDFPELF